MSGRRRHTVRHLVAVVTVLLVVGLAEPANGAPRAAADRPNVVVVMTDDQTVEQMRFLARTRALIGQQGTTFTNSFVNFPLCCPSRATFLTGQYVHNHGVDGNGPPPNGGYEDLDNSNTLPVWLRAAGYVTGHVGKYLNGYGSSRPTEVPPGWTEWYGLVGASAYKVYDYGLNRNGVVRQYGHAPADYQTDVLANHAASFIQRRAPGDAPFFLSVASLAPHREQGGPGGGLGGSFPIRPPPRYEHTYDRLALPKPPSFNEADVSDKPTQIRRLPRLSADLEQYITDEYRSQAEALLAVDDLVQRVYNALKASGELDDTIFIFTSDNGYFHGEHRVLTGKIRPYEPSVRVPLLVRGPGFDEGETQTRFAVNADLAPTIVEAAEATPRRRMDGRLLDDLDSQRALLIQAANVPNTYSAIRTTRWAWIEYDDGQRELYDMAADPHQLRNLAKSSAHASTRADLAERLDELRTCKGPSDCR